MIVPRPEVPLTVITPDDVRASIRRARKSLVDAANEVVWQIEMEAWRTLGYPSWTAMREAEYGGVAFMVPGKDRPELVARIRAKGETQQEIADTVGVSVGTVNSDLKFSSENERPTITNSRGQQRPATYQRTERDEDVIDAEVVEDYVTDQADLDEQAFMDATSDVSDEQFEQALAASREQGDLSQENVAANLRRAEAHKPRRAPLPDAFWRAAYDLTKVTERIERLTQDDRFPQNAEKVATANRSDLIRARDLLQQVIDSIPEI